MFKIGTGAILKLELLETIQKLVCICFRFSNQLIDPSHFQKEMSN